MAYFNEIIPISKEKDGLTVLCGLTNRDNAHRMNPVLTQIKSFPDIKSFYDEGSDKLTHPVVSVIPILRDYHNEILITDKFQKSYIKATIRSEIYSGPKIKYDFAAGGHITLNDLSKTDLESGILSFETVKNCLLREMKEELRSFDNKILDFDENKLIYIDKFAYDNSFSREICYTFVYPVRGKASDYSVWDDYNDENNKKREIILPVISMSFESLREWALRPDCDDVIKCLIGENSSLIYDKIKKEMNIEI